GCEWLGRTSRLSGTPWKSCRQTSPQTKSSRRSRCNHKSSLVSRQRRSVLRPDPIHTDHAHTRIPGPPMASTPARLPDSPLGEPGTHVDHLASGTRRAFASLPPKTTGRSEPHRDTSDKLPDSRAKKRPRYFPGTHRAQRRKSQSPCSLRDQPLSSSGKITVGGVFYLPGNSEQIIV